MTDYIGARLSLVSKSDIRYVGILHEIDSVNSTVSLEQVRSFGTEGRKGDPALEIPASDNVFEYIIFRGSDVKDLRVEQGATQPAPTPRQAPQDPAALQTGQAPKPQQNSQFQGQQGPPRGFEAPSYGPSYGMHHSPQGFGYDYPPQQQQHFPGPPQGYGYPGQYMSPQPSAPPQDQNQGIFAPQPQNAFPELPSAQTSGGVKSTTENTPGQKPGATSRPQGTKPPQAKIVPALPLPGLTASPRPKTIAKAENELTKGLENLSTTEQQPAAPAVVNAHAPKRNALLEVSRNKKPPTAAATKPSPADAAGAPPTVQSEAVSSSEPEPVIEKKSPAVAPAARGGRRSPNNTRRSDSGINHSGLFANPKATIVIPSSEYDFSAANSKFTKESIDVAAPAAPIYDKKSSFFDQMSTGPTQREFNGNARGRGREAFQQARTLNYETFGEDLAVRNDTRGRGRGGRGRGRGRGRGAAQAVQQ